MSNTHPEGALAVEDLKKEKDAEHQDAIIIEGTYEDEDSAGSIEPNCNAGDFFRGPILNADNDRRWNCRVRDNQRCK